jgi:hypothetical protein
MPARWYISTPPEDRGLTDAGDHGHAVLHHFADVVAEQAPVGSGLHLDVELDLVRAEPVFVEVVAPVGNLAGEHRAARALAAFGVGARAQHRVDVDHRRGFHPGAVLAAGWHVAHRIGRAGVQHLHAEAGAIGLALAMQPDHFRRNALAFGVLRVDALLQVRAAHGDLRDFDHLGTVEVELGEDGVHAAMCLAVVAQERRRGAHRAADVAGVDETLGAQCLPVAHQQVHRLLARLAVLAVEHLPLVGGELHRAAVACAAARGRR